MYTLYKENESTNESIELDSQDIVCSWIDIAGLMHLTNIIEKKKYNIYNKLDSLQYFNVISGLLYWSLINECDYSLSYIIERLNKKIILTPISQELETKGLDQDDNIIFLSFSISIIIESVIYNESNKLTLIDAIEKAYNLLITINSEFLRVPELRPLTGFSQDRGQVIFENHKIMSAGISAIFDKYQNSLSSVQSIFSINIKSVSDYYISRNSNLSNQNKATSIINNFPFLVS